MTTARSSQPPASNVSTAAWKQTTVNSVIELYSTSSSNTSSTATHQRQIVDINWYLSPRQRGTGTAGGSAVKTETGTKGNLKNQ